MCLKNIAFILNYPLQNQIEVGHLDVLITQYKNALEVFDQVHLLSPRDNREYALGKNIFVHSNSCTSRLFYYPSILWDAWKLLKIVREHDIKVIRALAPTSGFAAVLVGKITGIPVIVSVHADQKVAAADERRSALKNLLINAIEPFVMRHADLIPVISKHVRNYALKTGAETKKIVFHPNFVDEQKFRPRGKRGKNEVLFVGRLSKVKGGEEAIRAMALVVKERPEAVLKIAGKGEEEQNLHSLVKQLKLEKNVVFLGRVDHEKQLPKLMSESSVFVAPQTAGFTLIEAMSSGLPIVAGDVEWSQEVIKSGETGLLVKPEPQEIARAILQLLNSPQKARQLGENAQRIALEKFSLRAWKRREIAFYEKFLG